MLEAEDAQPVRDPRSYLTTVARRILIDDIRHREIERAYLAVHADRAGDVDYLTPERITEATQLLGAILYLLETLPEKARRAFMMVRFDRLRYADAGRQLGVSERMGESGLARLSRVDTQLVVIWAEGWLAADDQPVSYVLLELDLPRKSGEFP